jgi:threonyl-tRNA synthetase
MRVLIQEYSHFSFKTLDTQLSPSTENFLRENKEKSFNNSIVLFFSIEKQDIFEDCLSLLNTRFKFCEEHSFKGEIIFFPYAHLSDNICRPTIRLDYCLKLQKIFSTHVFIPFGWQKEITGVSTGINHYLQSDYSENSEKENRKGFSFKVFEFDGNIIQPCIQEGKAYNELSSLKKIALVEFFDTKIKRTLSKQFTTRLDKLDIRWSTRTEKGHLIFRNEALRIKKNIENSATEYTQSIKLDALIPFEGAFFSSTEKTRSKEQFKLFSDRLFTFPRQKIFMRYAACHGHLRYLKDTVMINPKFQKYDTIGLFEMAKAFRYEKTGELIPLYRNRTFTIPDLHTLTKKENELETFFLMLATLKKFAIDNEIQYIPLITFASPQVFEHYKQILYQFPEALIQIYDENAPFYWAVNIEMFFLDSQQVPRELATIQLDTGSPLKFGLPKGDEYSLIHYSICGSIERFFFFLLDKYGTHLGLPLQFSHQYIHILPVSQLYLNKANELKEQLAPKFKNKIFVNYENYPLGKKIKTFFESFARIAIIVGGQNIEIKTKTNEKITFLDLLK